MIHPHTKVAQISDEIGVGVIATKFIPKGTITWVLDRFDQHFTPEEVSGLEEIYQNILKTYSYRDNLGNYVLCWDNARFVNHSFNANCLSTAYDFEVAIRDINPGEQLTDDYGYLNVESPFQGIDEGTERKVVYPDDLIKYHNVWDEKLDDTFNLITKVRQPLKSLFSRQKWGHLGKIANGEQKMDSILKCYFDDKRNGLLRDGQSVEGH